MQEVTQLSGCFKHCSADVKVMLYNLVMMFELLGIKAFFLQKKVKRKACKVV